MKILIIGGTGLISTSITAQLLARGDDVTIYNRGKSEVRFPGTVRRIIGDRKQYADFERQMRDAGSFDCVMDMVGYAPQDEASAVRAFSGRAKHFIFCSTVDVYTKPYDRYPYREDASRRALGSYGQDKVRCEDILMDAHRRGDLAVTLIRPAHTYGEGSGLISSLGSATYLDRLRKGKPIVVHGDGTSIWCSAHVDDVGRAFVIAAGNPKALGRAYHTAGEEWMTWNLYHERVAEAMDAPPPVMVHIPTDLLVRAAPKRAGVCGINFQYNNIYDNAAARADIGYCYTVPFVEGARRTIRWLDARGRIEDSAKDTLDDRLIAAWQRLGDAMAAENLEG